MCESSNANSTERLIWLRQSGASTKELLEACQDRIRMVARKTFNLHRELFRDEEINDLVSELTVCVYHKLDSFGAEGNLAVENFERRVFAFIRFCAKDSVRERIRRRKRGSAQLTDPDAVDRPGLPDDERVEEIQGISEKLSIIFRCRRVLTNSQLGVLRLILRNHSISEIAASRNTSIQSIHQIRDRIIIRLRKCVSAQKDW